MDNNDYVNGLGFCCNPAGETTGSLTGKMTAKNDNAELQQFYYHLDHLGSSSYISNLDGEVVQHIEYVPFGEVFLEEKNAKWNTPYLFTSKELDRETGMYYFGARYQDPKLGIFISVDPLAEKFAGWSSYAYANDNPIRFTDPTGMSSNEIIVNGSQAKKYTEQLNSASNLNITRDEDTGKLSATGIAKTKADKKLLQAINDKDISVKIDATSDNFRGNNVIFGGAFGGSEYNNGIIVATQVVNPIQTTIIEDLIGMSKGTIAMHETLEAYLGAIKSPGAGGFNSDVRSYERAHKDAMKLEPNAKKVNTLNGFRVRASNENSTENTATYSGVIWKGMDYRSLFIDENVPIKRK